MHCLTQQANHTVRNVLLSDRACVYFYVLFMYVCYRSSSHCIFFFFKHFQGEGYFIVDIILLSKGVTSVSVKINNFQSLIKEDFNLAVVVANIKE